MHVPAAASGPTGGSQPPPCGPGALYRARADGASCGFQPVAGLRQGRRYSLTAGSNTAGGAAAKRKPDAASVHGYQADIIALHIILQPSPRLMRNNGVFFYPICLYRVLFCHKAHRAIEEQEHEACALFFGALPRPYRGE